MSSRLVLPNLVIAGVGRSGTTAMYQYLIEHPDVCGSKKKEISYFVDAIYGTPLAPIESYAALFDHHDGERILVEATPSYFSCGRTVAELIDRTLGPEAKIVVSLRDPAVRLVSSYNLYLSRRWIDPGTTLEEYVDMCQRSPSVREGRDENLQKYQGYHGGFYADVLPDWISAFGDRLLVVFFERLQADTARLMIELADWLGIDAAFYGNRDFEIQNPTQPFRFGPIHRLANAVNDKAEFWLRRRPALKNALRKMYASVNGVTAPSTGADAEVRQRLRDIYADSNHRTRALLEACGYTELPSWLSPASS